MLGEGAGGEIKMMRRPEKEDSFTIRTSMKCHLGRVPDFAPLGEVERFVRPGGSGARVGIPGVPTDLKDQWVNEGLCRRYCV